MNDDNLNSMMCLDIYLSSLSDEEYAMIANRLISRRVFPLMSWDIAGNYLQNADALTVQEDDRSYLRKLAKKHKWTLDVDTIIPNFYQAIVVTNAKQEINWISEGFTAMTGYSSEYALGKKPNFLQGNNTSPDVRKEIKESLRANKVYNGRIVNYRKNEEEYVCEVKIIPITNKNDKVTHFIAFEREAV
jgi:PAS domain S-box-containing protein